MKRSVSLVFVGVLLAAGCGSDPQPSASTAGDTRPPSSTSTAPVASASGSAAPGPAASASGAPMNVAGDPAALLGGGAALDALPTRATSPGRTFDPKLRRRLMPPKDPLQL